MDYFAKRYHVTTKTNAIVPGAVELLYSSTLLGYNKGKKKAGCFYCSAVVLFVAIPHFDYIPIGNSQYYYFKYDTSTRLAWQ